MFDLFLWLFCWENDCEIEYKSQKSVKKKWDSEDLLNNSRNIIHLIKKLIFLEDYSRLKLIGAILRRRLDSWHIISSQENMNGLITLHVGVSLD